MIKAIHYNQKGIAHMMLILVVLVIAGVGGAGYYVYSNQKDSDSSKSTAIQKAAEAECKRTIEDKDLCKMASNSNFEKENYVIAITGSQDGQQFTWTVQNDGENSHANMLGFESITYNGDSYLKGADGTWTKYPKSESDEEVTSDLSETLDFSDEEATWYTKIGKEACGSLTCFHYSYKDPNDATNNAEFWFDDEDYKIRKITSVSPEAGSVEMVITYGNAKVSPPETYTE